MMLIDFEFDASIRRGGCVWGNVKLKQFFIIRIGMSEREMEEKISCSNFFPCKFDFPDDLHRKQVNCCT
jgi:hypothetical protein